MEQKGLDEYSLYGTNRHGRYVGALKKMTDIYFDKRKAVKLEVFTMGEMFYWMRFTFKDGSIADTYPVKGTL